jgi:hypothetical protein
MMEALFLLVSFLKSGFKNQTELALENLALRQQLAILKRNRPHARLKMGERIFWACRSCRIFFGRSWGIRSGRYAGIAILCLVSPWEPPDGSQIVSWLTSINLPIRNSASNMARRVERQASKVARQKAQEAGIGRWGFGRGEFFQTNRRERKVRMGGKPGLRCAGDPSRGPECRRS